MPAIPDLVRDSKLETEFHDEYTQHVYYVSGHDPRQRTLRREERWKREKHLGAGSFGTVWKEKLVTESDDIKYRAVKEIKKSAQGSSAINYSPELEAVAKFSHPKYERCFVASSGWFENDVSVFIAMEYFSYGDLQNYLSSLIPERETRQITSQILEGLLFMHDNGFAHRDLKPANILVKCTGPDWWVKIGDFGISKRAEEGLTALRTFNGTPGFLAPEILSQYNFIDDDALETDDGYTEAVDLWALGVIVFLALIGKHPFPKRSLFKHIREKSGFPADILRAHGVSSEGCDIVERLMAVIPKDRLTAKEALAHKWISIEPETSVEEGAYVEMKRPASSTEITIPFSKNPFRQASARWSTIDHVPSDLTNLTPTDLPGSQSLSTQASARWSTVNDITLKPNDFTKLAPTILPFQNPFKHASGSWSRINDVTNDLTNLAPSEVPISQNLSTQALTDWSTMDDATFESNNFANLAPIEEPPARYREIHKALNNLSTIENSERLGFGNETINSKAHSHENHNHLMVKPARHTLERHAGIVSCVAFSPDGALVASGSYDHTLRLWEIATGTTRYELKGHNDFVSSVTFSPNGALVVSGSHDTTVQLWDTATGIIRRELKGHTEFVKSVAFSLDGTLIASGSADKTVRLWATATRITRHELQGHTGPVTSVAFSPDGALVASGSWDATVRLWDTATGAIRRELKGHTDVVRSVAFSPDGALMASGSSDHTVRLWDTTTEKLKRKIKGHTGPVYSVAFSPNGALIASGSHDTTVRLWDTTSGVMCRKMGHPYFVTSVAFSPDGALVASGLYDKTVRLWDLRSEDQRTRIGSLSDHIRAMFSI